MTKNGTVRGSRLNVAFYLKVERKSRYKMLNVAF